MIRVREDNQSRNLCTPLGPIDEAVGWECHCNNRIYRRLGPDQKIVEIVVSICH